MIAWWVVCFWFIRDSLMRFVLEPLARRAGIKERRAIVRFTEQGYMLCYYSECESRCVLPCPLTRLPHSRLLASWTCELFAEVDEAELCRLTSPFTSTSCKRVTTRTSTLLSTTSDTHTTLYRL